MGMYKCIKCGSSMCDPDLYNKVDGETRTGGKMKIRCPSCNKVQTIKEMHEKELLNTPDEKLTPKGIKAKERLLKSPAKFRV